MEDKIKKYEETISEQKYRITSLMEACGKLNEEIRGMKDEIAMLHEKMEAMKRMQTSAESDAVLYKELFEDETAKNAKLKSLIQAISLLTQNQ